MRSWQTLRSCRPRYEEATTSHDPFQRLSPLVKVHFPETRSTARPRPSDIPRTMRVAVPRQVILLFATVALLSSPIDCPASPRAISMGQLPLRKGPGRRSLGNSHAGALAVEILHDPERRGGPGARWVPGLMAHRATPGRRARRSADSFTLWSVSLTNHALTPLP